MNFRLRGISELETWASGRKNLLPEPRLRSPELHCTVSVRVTVWETLADEAVTVT